MAENRKIVISSAAQAIITILERRGLNVALTGDLAIYLHGGLMVPKVSIVYRAHASTLSDLFFTRRSQQSFKRIQTVHHLMFTPSCSTKTLHIFVLVVSGIAPFDSTILLAPSQKGSRIGAIWSSRSSTRTHLSSSNRVMSVVCKACQLLVCCPQYQTWLASSYNHVLAIPNPLKSK